MKTIGILGGMGPRATVLFERMLVEKLKGIDQELPSIITINDGSVPDRSAFLMGTGRTPVPHLQANLNTLTLAGADVIAIPCNTASMPAIFNQLTTTAQMLSLPQLVVKELKAKNIKRVCLLATKGTTKSHYYQRLCRNSGIRCIPLPFDTQEKVSQVIRLIKEGNTAAGENIAREIAITLKNLGCTDAILGCTELSIVTNTLVPQSINPVDTLAILADACVQYSKGEIYATR